MPILKIHKKIFHMLLFKKHFVFKLSIAALPLFTLCLVFSEGGFTTQELKWSIQCALVGQLTQA